jgi:NAD-dependent deacetylase
MALDVEERLHRQCPTGAAWGAEAMAASTIPAAAGFRQRILILDRKPMTDLRTAIATAAERLRAARRVTVLTGAGVSAASGVPTFRGQDGLWRNFRAEDLATPHAFRRDPDTVWAWYDWRRQRIAQAAPNAAHRVLAAWTARDQRCTLITQNVDGLHERAGTERLVRLHGSIWHLRCARGCTPESWTDLSVPLVPLPPRCRHCHQLARPDVVWFGEPLRPADLAAARDATACDLFLAVGTSSVVYPAAGLLDEARRRGAFTIEINAEATAVSNRVDLAIAGRAEVVLPAISRESHPLLMVP